MKKITIVQFFLLVCTIASAQTRTFGQDAYNALMNEEISTHITFGEPVKYVDISTNKVVGDIPVDNILRLKPILIDESNPYREGEVLAMVTIVTERYKAQFNCIYTTRDKAVADIDLPTENMISYVNVDVDMAQNDMRKFCWAIWNNGKNYFDVSREAYKLRITLNNVYTVKGYFFIDLSLRNKTNIEYDVDQIRFKIEDKKRSKATNFQQIEVNPVMSINEGKTFKKEYRNVFVFDKFTFPDEKVFTVEFAEDQISGRTVILKIDYADILNADAFDRKLYF